MKSNSRLVLAIFLIYWIVPAQGSAMAPHRVIPPEGTGGAEMNAGRPVVQFPAMPGVRNRGYSWLWYPPGTVVAPILLYHHVADTGSPSRYSVSTQDFAAQMASLHAWGYRSIPVSLLVKALVEGAYLPDRPVVITFDDGYQDTYENAFPVMRSYGFTGAVYAILGQVGIKGYMHETQLKGLLSAGWEVGSHSRTHANLRRAGVKMEAEIQGSRDELGAILGSPVTSFSFPYGLTNPYITRLVREAGYESAVGLGGLNTHGPQARYYLSRIEVQGTYDLETFANLLPWSEPFQDRHHFDYLDQ